jgi:hypothetical protein
LRVDLGDCSVGWLCGFGWPGRSSTTFTLDPDQVAVTITVSGLPAGTLTIELPTHCPDVAVPVVELFLVPGS